MGGVVTGTKLEVAEVDGLAAEAEGAKFLAAAVGAAGLRDQCSRRGLLRGGSVLHPLTAAQQALQARKKNRQLEWFRDVIIGAGCKSFQNVFRTRTRGQQ